MVADHPNRPPPKPPFRNPPFRNPPPTPGQAAYAHLQKHQLIDVSLPPPAYPDNNPKSAEGAKKAQLHLVPGSALVAEAGVFQLGAKKYGAFNWRERSVAATVYQSAALRHLLSWFDGEDIDPESGQSHLAHARACLGILLDAAACGNLIDDRPTKGATSRIIQENMKS